MLRRSLLIALGLLAAFAATGCRVPASPAGRWRAVLTSPGGELPFTLNISPVKDGWRAVVVNGAEEAPVSAVQVDGREVTLSFAGYDSRIVARIAASGDRLTGRWERTGSTGVGQMPFAAAREDGRFRPMPPRPAAGAPAFPSVTGTWAATFTDDQGDSPAQGELRQQGSEVTGTFLTPTGDDRYLAGSYERGVLRLSTFDGAHAFLFQARAQPDGTLRGDFWSRESYHATWTARRAAAGEAVLPDAWSLVGLKNPDGRFGFRFPDLAGRPVALADPAYAGKVVLVNLFGSWCPNCNDEAPLLAEWYRRYHGRGLEIVGLAYEFTGRPERDREFVRRFAERYRIGYPLLLAGTSDKQQAAATLPDLTAVVAFPTTVFVGRDGKVRKIYTGFAGPGTGGHFVQLEKELQALIEQLLAEPLQKTAS